MKKNIAGRQTLRDEKFQNFYYLLHMYIHIYMNSFLF